MKELEVQLQGLVEDKVATRCVFSYSVMHAAAIKMTFLDVGPIIWHVGRDLLSQGMYGTVGEGDVNITPDDMSMNIRLMKGEQAAHIRFHKVQVAAFIHATFMMVPRGHEFDDVDWDSELTTLGDK